MAKQVFSDCELIVGPYEIGALANQFAVDGSAETLDSTNFASGGWREVEGGERRATGRFQGFVDDGSGSTYGYLDDVGSNTANVPIIVTDTRAAAAGDDAVLFESGVISNFSRGGTVNQIAEMSFDVESKGLSGGGFYGGTLTGATTSGTTTGVEAGAVSAGQYLLAILSVQSAATGTLDVVLESDGDNTFASATTRATFTQATTSVTSQAISTAGAITDTWFRFNYTIGSSGTYTFRVALAIVTP